jgi:hypothetical protein
LYIVFKFVGMFPSLSSFSVVGIVGSRDFPAPELVRQFVSLLPAGCRVVSGAGGAVDLAAAAAARQLGLPVTEFPANWERYGPSAGPIRNKQIVSASIQVLFVFLSNPGAPGKGSASVMRIAAAAGVPVVVFGVPGVKV